MWNVGYYIMWHCLIQAENFSRSNTKKKLRLTWEILEKTVDKAELTSISWIGEIIKK